MSYINKFKLSELHKEKENLQNEVNLILTKYGLILNYWTPKVQIKETTKAFYNMYSLGMDVYPKENANLEAVEDYNNWYSLQQDISEVSTKCLVVGMKIEGFSNQSINEKLQYKPEIDWDQILFNDQLQSM
jgi:hypothetical protein